MLAVDGLLGDAERVGDLLPGPALGAGVADVQGLELVEQATQRGDGPQADRGVGAVEVAREVGGGSRHVRQHMLTDAALSTHADEARLRRRDGGRPRHPRFGDGAGVSPMLSESSTDPSAARCATLRPGRGRVPIV